MSRRWLSPEAAADIGRLDPEAIARVRSEAWPEATNADELHDALVWLGFLSMAEADAGPGWRDWLSDLARHKRVARLDGGARAVVDHGGAPAAVPGAMARRHDLNPRSPRRQPMPSAAGRATRRWWKSCAAGSRARAGYAGDLGRSAWTCVQRDRRARSRRSKPKASPCAGASRRERQPKNGASAGSWRAFTATPSSGCGPRSSRSRRAISCVSCSAGSASRPTPGWKGRRRSIPWSASSKASRRPPAPGRARSFRRVSPATSQPGSTIVVSRGMSPGRGCGRARDEQAMDAPNGSEGRATTPCAPRRSR